MNAPVGWLLDTNVVSEMMRPHPEPRVAAFLDEISDQGIGLASITVWEILNGIGLLDAGRRRDDLAKRFHGLLDDLFEDRIFDWTLDDAWECARIMEARRRQGEPLEDHLTDAMLAGSAASRGLVVVTRNTRDFQDTGVRAVDPWRRQRQMSD